LLHWRDVHALSHGNLHLSDGFSSAEGVFSNYLFGVMGAIMTLTGLALSRVE
jgi:hypothetical protein